MSLLFLTISGQEGKSIVPFIFLGVLKLPFYELDHWPATKGTANSKENLQKCFFFPLYLQSC